MMWDFLILVQAQVHEPVRIESPFTDYTASAVTYVLLVGVLVTVLLVGGFLILNLGLLSKRQQDRIGGRTPGDVGILKESTWPEEPGLRRTLPAEETDDELGERDQT